MDDDGDEPSTNFVPCVKWVRRGVAQSHPVKVELSKQELEEVIRQTRATLRVTDDDDEDSGTETNDVADGDDEYNMDAYDDEVVNPELSFGAVVDVDAEDEFNVDDIADSDDEDDLIKPTDNLIIVGHVEGDASILEIYVHNEEEGSLYIHHDLLLNSIPLALEWLNYDPSNVHTPGNLCAVGSMSPIIEVWDLDLVNTLTPAFKLGRKRSIKKNLSAIGHKDAVLDLSWNTNLSHIMASGSVDQKVLLWDLEVKTPNTELTHFAEKVQAVKWHPFEGETLLTGSADKTCKVWDCRTADSYKSWSFGGEIERVCWNNSAPKSFFASDDGGNIHYVDSRTDSPIWSIKAHDNEVTGIHASPVVPGMLLTCSQGGKLRVWDTLENGHVLVVEKDLRVGQTQCLDVASDSPFTIAVGGDYSSHNFGVQSLLDTDAVKFRFGSRQPLQPPEIEGVAIPGTSNVRVREKRPRSADRALNVKKKSKGFKKLNK